MKNFSANQNYIRFSVLSPLEKSLYYSQIYVFLKRVCIEYPGFSKWYKDLFFSNKELQNGREIIICEKDYRMAGVAILKSAKNEKKICTLRVAGPFQRQGIGRTLMELSFDWLQDDKPLITMHKSKQHEFAPLLDYYGFVLEQTQRNYYHVFNTELSYNGVLPPKKLFFNKLELLDIDMWYKNFISSGKYDLTDFVEECINKWLIQEQKRQLEMLGLNMSAY